MNRSRSQSVGYTLILKNGFTEARMDINYTPYQLARSIEEVDESPGRRAIALRSKVEN
jgi:hypothetical protein